jgi:glycogen debranching enzyme
MSPRLQGELSPDGTLALSVWGAGEVGRLKVEGLDGRLVIGPNRIETATGAGLFAAQSAPAVALRGARPTHHWPSGEGGFIVERRGADWLIAAGADEAEAARALALATPAVAEEAAGHIARCDLAPGADPLLRSLVLHGVHAALASVRQDAQGAFAGLAAGLAYSNPPRTYYRDGYWTLQLLLRLAPEIAAAQIDLLAETVQSDGEAPSAVIIRCRSAEAFERERLAQAAMAAVHWRPGEWWSDHFDSPLFFVLAVADHSDAVGDDEVARRHWPRLAAVFERYLRLRGPAGLPVKPRNDRDWADNVYREGLVAYDLGLWIGALDALARLADRLDPPLASRARAEVIQARAAVDAALWRGDCYVDYARADGWSENHLALDALMLLRFDAAPEDRAGIMLDHVRARLESRRNPDQPYGDFGMLCAWPPFADASALRAKSAFPYRYHNGGEWPWLDAVYAAERLRRNLPGWRYPLTRWWEMCLERGWAGPVEHYSTPFGRGSLLQAWSSLPAAVALRYAEQMASAGLDEA